MRHLQLADVAQCFLAKVNAHPNENHCSNRISTGGKSTKAAAAAETMAKREKGAPGAHTRRDSGSTQVHLHLGATDKPLNRWSRRRRAAGGGEDVANRIADDDVVCAALA